MPFFFDQMAKSNFFFGIFSFFIPTSPQMSDTWIPLLETLTTNEIAHLASTLFSKYKRYRDPKTRRWRRPNACMSKSLFANKTRQINAFAERAKILGISFTHVCGVLKKTPEDLEMLRAVSQERHKRQKERKVVLQEKEDERRGDFRWFMRWIRPGRQVEFKSPGRGKIGGFAPWFVHDQEEKDHECKNRKCGLVFECVAMEPSEFPLEHLTGLQWHFRRFSCLSESPQGGGSYTILPAKSYDPKEHWSLEREDPVIPFRIPLSPVSFGAIKAEWQRSVRSAVALVLCWKADVRSPLGSCPHAVVLKICNEFLL